MIAESSKVSALRISTQSETAPKILCECKNWWEKKEDENIVFLEKPFLGENSTVLSSHTTVL